jgi:hypothetical protein
LTPAPLTDAEVAFANMPPLLVIRTTTTTRYR